MAVVTRLVEIRRLGAAKQAENLDFRRYLSAHHHRVEELQAIAGEIARHIDCTACANCCRSSLVAVNRGDIETIARYLGCPPADVERLYTDPDPESHTTRLLRNNSGGCVFLDGTLCTVYAARPKTCRDFPHVDPGTHSLGSRVSSLCRWAPYCPIVYNALEAYKHHVGYHPHASGGAHATALPPVPG